MALALDSWVEGMMPGEWSIHGLKMHEITFGHMVLMERMLCSNVETPDDLAHAIMICSRSFTEAQRYAMFWKTDKKMYRELADCLEQIVKHPKEVLESWAEYYSSHTKQMGSMKPHSNDSCGERRKLGSPNLAIIRVLAIKLGYNPKDINESPFSQMILDIQTNLELCGRTEISGGIEVANALEEFKEMIRSRQNAK